MLPFLFEQECRLVGAVERIQMKGYLRLLRANVAGLPVAL